MSNKNHIEALKKEKERRLQKLKKQQAQLGINTFPEILTEIEDLDNEIKQLALELINPSNDDFSHFLEHLKSELSIPTSDKLHDVSFELKSIYVHGHIVPNTPEHQTLQPQSGSSSKERQPPKPSALKEILKPEKGRIFLGYPGAGKTSLIQHIALEYITQLENKTGKTIPIVISLDDYANQLAEQHQLGLSDFLRNYYTNSVGVDKFDSLTNTALDSGEAIILLDALDEVEPSWREHVIDQINKFVRSYKKKGNIIIITSRPSGYDQKLFKPALWQVYTLLGFDDDKIKIFINKWFQIYRQQKPLLPPGINPSTEAKDLFDQIRNQEDLKKLAKTPLLLMIMALLQAKGFRLPQHLYELYELYFEILLGEKIRRSVYQSRSKVGTSKTSSSQDEYKTAIRLLSLVTLDLWNADSVPFDQDALEMRLRHFLKKKQSHPTDDLEDEIQLFIERVCLETHLLHKDERYKFINPAFGEALTSRGLAALLKVDYKKTFGIFEDRITNEEWDSILPLAISYSSLKFEDNYLVGRLIREILEKKKQTSSVKCWETPNFEMDLELMQRAIFAGRCLRNIGVKGFDPSIPIVELINKNLEKVLWCANSEFVAERHEAGLILGEQAGWSFFSENAFKLVKKFNHPLGNDEKYNEVPDEYEIGAYPVTNREFRRFVEDRRGYKGDKNWFKEDKNYFKDEGLKWRNRDLEIDFRKDNPYIQERVRERLRMAGEGRMKHPFFWKNPDWNQDLLPVVGVTYYEAEAYCKWLSEKEGVEIRLPTPKEWELAAAPLKYGDQYPYPWGNQKEELTLAHAHFNLGKNKKGLRKTTPVCMYRRGRSWCEAWDMLGNVWEWTDDWYRPPRSKKKIRAVRGGAWNTTGEDVKYNFEYGYPAYFSDNYIGFRVVRIKKS